MPPLALNDDEYSAVLAAAGPIVPAERGAFLQALADELAKHSTLGGLVHRTAAALQRRFVIEARTEAELLRGAGHLAPRRSAAER
jgi:hypothetical protein